MLKDTKTSWSGVLITPSLFSSEWWELNWNYWSVCVGFLYTSMLRLLYSSLCTAPSKKGRLSATHWNRPFVHPKDKTFRHEQSNVVYAVQCRHDCTDLYIETKQPLHKWMAQHRRANSSGQDSAVHLHLKEKIHSFEDNNVNILSREDRWFERGAEESIYVKLKWQSLNRGGGLWHYLSPTFNAALSSLARQLNNHSHLGSPRPSNPHECWLD